jgi:hypothetical protein
MIQWLARAPGLVRALALVGLAALHQLAAPPPALAYLDPGSLGYVVQLVVATFFAFLYAFWRRIRLFVAGLFARTRKGEGSRDV